MAKQNNPVAVLIENIKTDKQLLIEKTEILDQAKEEQRAINARLREYQKDVAHMWKYMSEEQQAEIKDLGLDDKKSSGGRGGELNPISQIALDLLMKAKGNKLTNGELFQGYIDRVPVDEDAMSYTQFNIKIRQLFNSGRIEKKQLDPKKASRDDIISTFVDSPQK